MKVRLGLVLATVALISGTGCASGGGGGGPSGMPQAPTGPRPRDNPNTNSAELYLVQAQGAVDAVDGAAKYQLALQSAEGGILADPQNPRSYFQAAQAYVGLEDFAGADSMFTKAEELYPDYAAETEPWREQGWILAYNAAIVPLNSGDLEEALGIFEMANSLYPARPEAFLQAGSVLSQLDRGEEAVEAFRTGMELLEASKARDMADSLAAPFWDQNWGIATAGLGHAMTLAGQLQEAADFYGGLLADDPQNIELIGNLATVLTELQMPDSVQALYAQLLSRPDLTERDYFNAGVGLYQIEQYGPAADAFRAAAEKNPFNRDARLNLANTLYTAEEFEALIPAARDLLAVDPLNGNMWLAMTRGLNVLERVQEANDTFREYQAIGYEIIDIRLDGVRGGGAKITGQLKNTAGTPGETVTLQFHFGGDRGQEVGTQLFRVQLPAVEQIAIFQGTFESTQQVTGYRYEVVR
jgi:tetratricopeptide (TPR) repeat protein